MPSNYTSKHLVAGDNTLGGGLNSTAGNLQLQDNEASDLQNIDFDKFGSIVKRNGYTLLNQVPIGDADIYGLTDSDGTALTDSDGTKLRT